MAKIFISYKRDDKERVFPIVEKIKQNTGVDCWIDLNGIESGDQFQNVIINAIDNADIVVFMLSKNFVSPYKDEKTGMVNHGKQTFPEKEVMYALSEGKRLVPLSIDGTTVNDCKWLKFNCSGLDCIDWNKGDQRNKLFANIREWTGSSVVDDKREVVRRKKKFEIFNSGFHPVVNYGIVIQLITFLIVLLIVIQPFFYGCLALGATPKASQFLLTLAVCASIYSTCKIKTCKLYWLWLMFALDFVEIFLMCRIGVFLFKSMPHYPTSKAYTLFYEVGNHTCNFGFCGMYIFFIVAALLHIGVVCLALCAKKDGRSGWSMMK